MSTIVQRNAKLNTILADFASKNGGITSAAYLSLVAAFDASPALTTQWNKNVTHGLIAGIVGVKPEQGICGSFNQETKNVQLPIDPVTKNFNNTTANTLIFKLGHEAAHSENAQDIRDATQVFANAVNIKKWLPGAPDYTLDFQRKIAASGADESKAQLAGYNAVASSVFTSNPMALDIDYKNALEGYFSYFLNADGSPNHNLVFNSDNRKLEFTAANIAAEKIAYFDHADLGKPGSPLSYTNYNDGEKFRRWLGTGTSR